MTERSEEIIISRVQSGEVEAFSELFIRYHKPIFNLAYSFTHNNEDAQDISQEVFLKAFKSVDGFKEGSAFFTWLYKIALNTCIDFIRKRDRRSSAKLDFIANRVNCSQIDYFTPEKHLILKELYCKLYESIDRLPPRQREAFMLRHHHGMSIKDIAQEMSCSAGTVKAHLSYASRKVRRRLNMYLGRDATD